MSAVRHTGNPTITSNPPYFPQQYRPYTACDCNIAPTCGNPQNYSVKGVGGFYSVPHHTPFGAWTGQLVKSDLNPVKKLPYVPPSPCHSNVLCERPRGQQSCAMNTGADRCPP